MVSYQVFYKISQTTVRNSHCEIELNYEKLERNLGKLIKIHNESENLHILQREETVDKGSQLLQQTFNQIAPLRRSCIQQRPLSRHTYPLNSSEAVQLIWRAARIAKELGIAPAALKDIERDEYIGQNNKMPELITAIEKEIKTLIKKVGKDHKRTRKAQKYLKRLNGINQKISTIWKQARLKHERVFDSLQKQPLISLYSPHLLPSEKTIIVSHIRKQIIALDRSLLKETIMFILDIQGKQNCLVVPQQSYFSFLVKRQQLIEIIGLPTFLQGKKNYEVAKQMIGQQRIQFKFKKFSMCHKCLEMYIPGKNTQNYFICYNAKVLPDATTTPYAYQQILLLGNYSVIPQFYQKCKEQEVAFDKYVHPYAKTFSLQCSRFTCENCFASYATTKRKKKPSQKQQLPPSKHQSPESSSRIKRQLRPRGLNHQNGTDHMTKVDKQKPKKPSICHFCQSLCECQRCLQLQNFNRLLSLYTLFGGNFQQLAPQLIFGNWLSNKMTISIASETDLDAYEKLTQIELTATKRQSTPLTSQNINQMPISIAKKRQEPIKEGLAEKKSKKDQKNEKIIQKQAKKQIKYQKHDKEHVQTNNEEMENMVADFLIQIEEIQKPPFLKKIAQKEENKHEKTTADSEEQPQYTQLKKLFVMITLQEEYDETQQIENEKDIQVLKISGPNPPKAKKAKPTNLRQDGNTSKLKYESADSDRSENDLIYFQEQPIKIEKKQTPHIVKDNDFYFIINSIIHSTHSTMFAIHTSLRIILIKNSSDALRLITGHFCRFGHYDINKYSKVIYPMINIFKQIYQMLFRFKILPARIYPRLTFPRLYAAFGDNKRPFQREIRSSPIQRKSSSIWQRHSTPTPPPPPFQQKVEVAPPKEERKQTIIEKPATRFNQQSPIDKSVEVPGTPLEQQPPMNEKEVQIDFKPVPLDFKPFQTKKKDDEITVSSTENVQIKEETVQHLVMSNIGLNRYLTRIYVTSGVALMLTLASSYACIAFPFVNNYSQFLMMGGGIVSFMSFQKANAIAPKFFIEKKGEDTIYRTQNDPVRLAMFGVGCIALGLSAAPLFLTLHEVSNAILPMTIGVTGAIFGGASIMGLLLPKNMPLGYGGVLMGGLFGLVGLNLTGLMAGKFLGVTLFANTLTSAESYIGISIFTLMIIYDTHQAIKRYQRGNADHLGMSIQILLDLWNLIIRIATQIAKAKAKSQKK